MSIPRAEYPRPQFVREQWLNLNGVWQFDFDDENCGLSEQWFAAESFSQQITVPYVFQSPLSGIGNNDFHEVVWYKRAFDLPASWAGKRVILHFGAVDYRATVWVNGIFVGYHQGGHTPFSIDITAFSKPSGNQLVVRAEDSPEDVFQPRGKQYWKRDSASIFYTRTTGIWQTVWLEPVSDLYIKDLRITPDIDSGSVNLFYEFGGSIPATLEAEAVVSFGGKQVAQHSAGKTEENLQYLSQTVELGSDLALWSPETPNLYDLKVSVKVNGAVVDQLSAYFGMRKISIENGSVCLNNQPYYMRLVLDQGYHPVGILTFPTDQDYIKDIELTKALGFNGARKHQKVEDPRFLYHADRMGLLIWGEMANAYAYSIEYVQRITAEWQEAVRRDYSHPCIVAWTPMNESWGVPDLKGDERQRDHLVALYHLTRSLDKTRLVISNDGWEHARTDLLTIHDYEASGAVLQPRYATLDATLAARPAKRDLYAAGYAHQGEPILLTEFGGVAYRKSAQEGWGYSTAADEGDYLRRLKEIMDAVLASPLLQGFCYTQITDVEQEINGLLTYDRQPKAPVEKIAELIGGAHSYKA
jgi:beta-galactosidase/beta-glucuronidase